MFARKLMGFVASAAIVAGFAFTAHAGESKTANPSVLEPTETGMPLNHARSEAVETQQVTVMPEEERDLKDAVGETLTSFRDGLWELARSLTDF